jgi:hypothetical protein
MRRLYADFEYASWYATFDWTALGGRSITRWGSPNDAALTASYRTSGAQLMYNPSSAEVRSLLTKILMAPYRAVLGSRAIILSALWQMWRTTAGVGTLNLKLHSMIEPFPDLSDCTFVYKDATGPVTWFNGGYAPQWGQDVTSAPDAIQALDTTPAQPALDLELEIKDYFAQQLLENADLWFELFQTSHATGIVLGTSTASRRPKLDIRYLFPVEMYPADEITGNIDLSRMLNVDNQPINLGALRQGQTGPAHKFFLKNFSRQVLDLVELWDDFPEWSVPAADSGNTGSGVLGYVTPAEACVSQRWEVKFSSATEYEVKATSYLDNIESLHPSYDSDSAWEGLTSGSWTDPDGNITLPSAAWSGTPAANDLFVFYTKGNTTLNLWPADSNDQVEMADDVAGSPGTWRPINAQRTLLSAGVTIDAATKTVSVKRIDTTKWPVGDPIFLWSSANATIDAGTIKTVTATTIEIENLAVTSNVYAANDLVATTLPFTSLGATAWGQLATDCGVSQTYKDRLYVAYPEDCGFQDSDSVYVQNMNDGTIYEEAVVSAVVTGANGYLDLTADLVNDYVEGSLVVVVGSGEKAFHLRVVAGPTSNEERKTFRLNVIS